MSEETTVEVGCCKDKPIAIVSDRAFKRKLNSVIAAMKELVVELEVTRDSLLKGGKLKFDSYAVIAELHDLAAEIENARLDEFEESYPPNKGPEA